MQKEMTYKMTEEIHNILSRYSKTKENLIKALHELQEANPQNYISDEIMDLCASYFKLTKAQVYGVVTYYSMFSIKPRGTYHISLCKSPVCTMMGSENIFKYFEDKYHLLPSGISDDGFFSLEKVECLGRCGKAPSMMINKEFFTELSPEKIDEILLNLKNR